jgi:GDPmannose 4,6-dehydratase
MLQQKEPEDFCIASGESHSIRDFLDEAFNVIGIKDWSPYVRMDAQFNRPNDVVYLLGDSSKARKKLGWKPKTSFKQLVGMMMDADFERNRRIKAGVM